MNNHLEQAYAQIVEAALLFKRCPTNELIAGGSQSVGALARMGRIEVLISNKNYRTVVLLTGMHAGRSTLADPTRGRVWKVVNTGGTRINGKIFRNSRDSFGQEPSKPRDYSGGG